MTKIVNNMLNKIIEGLLFASSKPLSVEDILKLFDKKERPSLGKVRSVLKSLQAHYQDRGVILQEVASGFRFQVAQEMTPWVSKFWEEKPARLSRALLETLALIAYRQPITRGEIEDIRGVVVSTQIVRTLMELEWVRIVGHKEVPGRPALYSTTKQFLDHLNLKNLDELPPLAELRDLEEIAKELDQKMSEENSDENSEILDQDFEREAESPFVEPSEQLSQAQTSDEPVEVPDEIFETQSNPEPSEIVLDSSVEESENSTAEFADIVMTCPKPLDASDEDEQKVNE